MTSALMRRIDDETEAKRQAAWAERKEHGRVGAKRNPKWACDTLVHAGQISSDQHEAAQRYASALERSLPGCAGSYERVDGGGSDPHARLWDQAVCRTIVLDGRLWVLKSRSTARSRMYVLDRLFAFPQPTIEQMRRSENGGRLQREHAINRIVAVLDLLRLFWDERDRGRNYTL